jgi:hypothetical protein
LPPHTATFFGYSGQYHEGDRLVAGEGPTVTVSRVDVGDDEPSRLFVL